MIMKLSVCWPCVEQVCGSSRGCGSRSLARSASALFCTMHIRLLFPAPRPPSLFQLLLLSTVLALDIVYLLFDLSRVFRKDSAMFWDMIQHIYQNDVSFGFCRLRFCQKSNGDMSGNALFPSSFPASSICTKTLLSQKKVQRTTLSFALCCMISKGTSK